MLVIVDYRSGNIRALTNIFEREGVPCRIARTAAEILGATKLLLPGVGAFDHAVTQLRSSGMLEPLAQQVARGVPVLGICVGMQILADASDEGSAPGLGWVPGRVRRFDERLIVAGRSIQLPHMGWNNVTPTRASPLLEGLDGTSSFYFLHSFYFECTAPSDVLAEANYGGRFASAVNRRNVYGVQFHPEKSHAAGERLLINFTRM